MSTIQEAILTIFQNLDSLHEADGGKLLVTSATDYYLCQEDTFTKEQKEEMRNLRDAWASKNILNWPPLSS
jgi:hypothetical protein